MRCAVQNVIQHPTALCHQTFYRAIEHPIVPSNILSCHRTFYRAIEHSIVPLNILSCHRTFYRAIEHSIVPSNILWAYPFLPTHHMCIFVAVCGWCRQHVLWLREDGQGGLVSFRWMGGCHGAWRSIFWVTVDNDRCTALYCARKARHYATIERLADLTPHNTMISRWLALAGPLQQQDRQLWLRFLYIDRQLWLRFRCHVCCMSKITHA